MGKLCRQDTFWWTWICVCFVPRVVLELWELRPGNITWLFYCKNVLDIFIVYVLSNNHTQNNCIAIVSLFAVFSLQFKIVCCVVDIEMVCRKKVFLAHIAWKILGKTKTKPPCFQSTVVHITSHMGPSYNARFWYRLPNMKHNFFLSLSKQYRWLIFCTFSHQAKPIL